MEADSKSAMAFQKTTHLTSNAGGTLVNNTVMISYDLTDDTPLIVIRMNRHWTLIAWRLSNKAIKYGNRFLSRVLYPYISSIASNIII